jgi:NitT/TauT family transport system substrate-binding protein
MLMALSLNRRTVLAGLAAATGAGLMGIAPSPTAGLETRTVRLGHWEDEGAYCWASVYLAGELLRADGFDVHYVQGDVKADNSQWLADDVIDFDMNMPTMHILSLDRGVPITVLTGVHSGCFNLVAREDIRGVADLKGRRVGIAVLGGHPHLLLSLMAGYVGLDPVHEIDWVVGDSRAELFKQGKIDTYLSGEPEPLKLRDEKVGHVIVNTAFDKPWSDYFCCMIAGRADYVAKNPVATKRVLRAILQSADLCSTRPQLAADRLAASGMLKNKDKVLGTLRETRHEWRDFDAADTLRFYTLQLRELGLVKSTPDDILSGGTDWRFIKDLQRELKA